MTLWGKFDGLLSGELGGHRCGGGMGEVPGARAGVGVGWCCSEVTCGSLPKYVVVHKSAKLTTS